MNKKIKIITLLNKIANKEELPKNIKYNNDVFWLNKNNVYVGNELYLIDIIDEDSLNDYIVILEDNTEEIEEYKGESFEEIGYNVGKLSIAIAKGFEKAIEEFRKEKEDD